MSDDWRIKIEVAEEHAHGFLERLGLELGSEARELAQELERDGLGVAQRDRYVLVGAASEEEARELAARLHGDVEAAPDLVYEVMPQNPFAVFGGLADT